MTDQEKLLQKRLKRLKNKAENGIVTFKSYAEMCRELKIPQKTSDSKKAQLRQLNYFCNIEKTGNKNELSFSEVYDDPDHRIISEDAILTCFETILLATFIRNQTNSLLLSNYELWRLFGMMNSKYNKQDEEIKFMENTGISESSLLEFKNRCQSKFRYISESSLRKLRARRFIDYSQIWIIKEKNDFTNKISSRVATENESSRILSHERKLLEEFGVDNIYKIWDSGKSYSYYRELSKRIYTYENWHHVARGYQIITISKEWLKYGLSKDLNVLNAKRQLNRIILDKILSGKPLAENSSDEELTALFGGGQEKTLIENQDSLYKISKKFISLR